MRSPRFEAKDRGNRRAARSQRRLRTKSAGGLPGGQANGQRRTQEVLIFLAIHGAPSKYETRQVEAERLERQGVCVWRVQVRRQMAEDA